MAKNSRHRIREKLPSDGSWLDVCTRVSTITPLKEVKIEDLQHQLKGAGTKANWVGLATLVFQGTMVRILSRGHVIDESLFLSNPSGLQVRELAYSPEEQDVWSITAKLGPLEVFSSQERTPMSFYPRFRKAKITKGGYSSRVLVKGGRKQRSPVYAPSGAIATSRDGAQGSRGGPQSAICSSRPARQWLWRK
ncbi:hypothetical protein HAX54_031260 [Datura stramonium]|uniref:Uncharacterized protein n=1 Tax=Datura stramonium TaxID=4076 RepID=A0ABS8VAB0_DATST|nr:hypothetical protein [Datura stramonium]